MKILLVKTSSLGDIVHNLPVVSDIRANFPDAEIDWVVEEAFVEIPRLHPGVSAVLPLGLRRWRKTPFARSVWGEIGAFADRLREVRYDLVLDSQSLIKSALVSRLARGRRAGLDFSSAREPLASLFYDNTVRIPRKLHAIYRNRALAAHALGYEPQEIPDFGIKAPMPPLDWLPGGSYAVLLHATSRDRKLWEEVRWVALGKYFSAQGMRCVLPWCDDSEQSRSYRLAEQIADSVVPPRLDLNQVAALLAGAYSVVGVDTGLMHFAAALNAPTVALYCATDPALTGVCGGICELNLGNEGAPPEVSEVIKATERARESYQTRRGFT